MMPSSRLSPVTTGRLRTPRSSKQADDHGNGRAGLYADDFGPHDIAHGTVERGVGAARRILDGADRLDRDQTGIDQGAHAWQQPFDALRQVHPDEDDGQVGGERDDGRGVDAAVRAKARQPARDSCARRALAAQSFQDRHVERLAAVLVAFADIDGDARRLSFDLHRVLRPLSASRATGRGWPRPRRR